jgi:phage shock protein A
MNKSSSSLGNPPVFASLREQIAVLGSEIELLRRRIENLAEDNAKLVRQVAELRNQKRSEKFRPSQPR